jgi:inhibitor of cysteine peptidase
MAQIDLKNVDDGKAYLVSVGDWIVIHLDENPTTGYRWGDESPIPDFLERCGDDFSSSEKAGIGSSGIRTMRFRASTSGRGKVSLRLCRDWERQAAPLGQFTITIEAT